eukprot:2784525-Pleurochrysis_carterae.AAC.1
MPTWHSSHAGRDFLLERTHRELIRASADEPPVSRGWNLHGGTRVVFGFVDFPLQSREATDNMQEASPAEWRTA